MDVEIILLYGCGYVICTIITKFWRLIVENKETNLLLSYYGFLTKPSYRIRIYLFIVKMVFYSYIIVFL